MFYRFARFVVGGVFRLLFRVRIRGRDRIPSGVFVLAPSHRSVLDLPLVSIITPRRVRFMAKKELFTTRFGRWLFDLLGAIQVDRGVTDRSAIREAQAALAAGEPVGIFPEGTRRTGPVLGDLYDGVTYLALKLGVPVLPVGIGGSEEILATGKIMPRLHRVVIVVGEPIYAAAEQSARRRSDVARMSEQLRAGLQGCFDEARSAAGVDDTAPVAQRSERE